MVKRTTQQRATEVKKASASRGKRLRSWTVAHVAWDVKRHKFGDFASASQGDDPTGEWSMDWSQGINRRWQRLSHEEKRRQAVSVQRRGRDRQDRTTHHNYAEERQQYTARQMKFAWWSQAEESIKRLWVQTIYTRPNWRVTCGTMYDYYRLHLETAY